MMRVLAYERVRALTIPSTVLFPLIGISLAWAISVVFVTSADVGRQVPVVGFVGQAFSPLSALFITLPFAQAVGHEYRDQTMRLTLTTFPHRWQVLLAKNVVPAVVALLATVLCVLGIAGIASFGLTVGYDQLPGIAARACGFIVLWGLLVSSVTVLARNLAAGTAGVLVWGLVLEQVVAGLLGGSVPQLVQFLPVLQGTRWLQTGAVDGGLVMLVAAVILTAAAFLRFTRRDA